MKRWIAVVLVAAFLLCLAGCKCTHGPLLDQTSKNLQSMQLHWDAYVDADTTIIPELKESRKELLDDTIQTIERVRTAEGARGND